MIHKTDMQDYSIRPARSDTDIALVAERMRLTLIEVLGYDTGANMYSMDWLRERVRWHLDPAQCTGEVFVVEVEGVIVGHTVVRLEPGDAGGLTGLFSTIYVIPEARRRGIADVLVQHGEAWFASHQMITMGTSTSETNFRLIMLFEKHGYKIVLRVPESHMIHLSKTLAPSHTTPLAFAGTLIPIELANARNE